MEEMLLEMGALVDELGTLKLVGWMKAGLPKVEMMPAVKNTTTIIFPDEVMAFLLILFIKY